MKTFQYQNQKNKNYFEGWYFRITDAKTNSNYAVIFAITKNVDDPHSFIQVFNNNSTECEYFRFDTSDFSYNYENNEVCIGENYLSTESIYLNTSTIKIDIAFNKQVSLENLSGSNSAMGYLSNYPLECFQEVIYLNGRGIGRINEYSKKDISINGNIYIEKTYGSKFPVKWVWIQSNHSDSSSISFSVGKIPFFGIKTKGFLALLNTPEKLYRFYTGNLSTVNVLKDKIIVKRGAIKLILKPLLDNTIKLVGPSKKALMNLDVFESLTSTLSVELYKGKTLIFSDTYTNVGYENMW